LIFPFENLSDEKVYSASDTYKKIFFYSFSSYIGMVPFIDFPKPEEIAAIGKVTKENLRDVAIKQNASIIIYGNYYFSGLGRQDFFSSLGGSLYKGNRMLPIEEGLLLLLRVAFCKSYPENLYSLFFLQKEDVKTLFSLSFVGQQKKVKRKKNASAHASQSLQCTCSDFGSGELTSTLKSAF